MAAEVLAGLSVETVGWDHADAVRLRGEQQHEIDLRYAQPGRPSATGPDPRDQVDPSNVFATLLLRVDGEPAGHAALRDLSGRDNYRGGLHPDGTSEVKRVYVAPGFRGRGLSRALMEAVEDVARTAGVRHLILETGLMQPESLGLYLRMGYDPVESFGVFSDEPGSRCFGKYLQAASGQTGPAEDAGPSTEAAGSLPRPEVREVAWDDPDVADLRSGHDAVDAERGRSALTTFVATLDGRPVGCATVAAAQVGPDHLAADPLRGLGGLSEAVPAGARDSRAFEMRSVFVDPAARGAGVATALVRQAEAEARRRDGLALYLATGIREPSALRLYVQLGYRPVLPYPPYGDAEDPVLLFLGKAL